MLLINAVIALALVLALPARAAEEMETGINGSGRWTDGRAHAIALDVGSEQSVAHARFGGSGADPALVDVGAERVVLTGRSLAGPEDAANDTRMARADPAQPAR